MKLPTRFLMVAAAATLLSLSAACGSGGGAVAGGDSGTTIAQGGNSDGGSSGGGGDKAEICQKATKALQDFGQAATASSSGDFSAFNAAAKKLGTELEQLAGEADGDLKTTLSSMATAWGSLKVDTSDLAGSANKILEASKQASEQTQKLVTACA
ncbi:hypothetical protein AB0K60_05325 [Thermopolyspora sp. NPDC052614]|uniref:hypothetical protein n=1 Tax=Thermopolyspora sp. NPDC052614 TaxID=3155682 RepID=UPI003424B777